MAARPVAAAVRAMPVTGKQCLPSSYPVGYVPGGRPRWHDRSVAERFGLSGYRHILPSVLEYCEARRKTGADMERVPVAGRRSRHRLQQDDRATVLRVLQGDGCG